MNRRALGRGLRALIPEGAGGAALETREVPIDAIVPNRYQPRMKVDEEGLAELAASIRQHGVLEPIIVRPVGNGYELVVGERRWRAAGRAGLRTVPAVVREMSDREAMAVALVENLQREQLDPIEEALGFKRLMELFQITQEEVAQEVGRSRSSVANSLRLLTLEEDIQEMLRDGRLSVGHAKVLLGIEDGAERRELAREIASKGLSVRETEGLVAQRKAKKGQGKGTVRRARPDPVVRAVEEKLETALGTRVRVTRRARGGGLIEIEYYSDEDIARIVETIAGNAAPLY